MSKPFKEQVRTRLDSIKVDVNELNDLIARENGREYLEDKGLSTDDYSEMKIFFNYEYQDLCSNQSYCQTDITLKIYYKFNDKHVNIRFTMNKTTNDYSGEEILDEWSNSSIYVRASNITASDIITYDNVHETFNLNVDKFEKLEKFTSDKKLLKTIVDLFPLNYVARKTVPLPAYYLSESDSDADSS